MEGAIHNFLDHALARRHTLAALLSAARATEDQDYVANIEYRIAQLDGAIAFLLHTTTVH